MKLRIRIYLRPCIDLLFRTAFERACVAASVAGADLDTPDAARIVEEELRSAGYPNAEIDLFRSVEEYRNHVSNWLVWRGSPWTPTKNESPSTPATLRATTTRERRQCDARVSLSR